MWAASMNKRTPTKIQCDTWARRELKSLESTVSLEDTLVQDADTAVEDADNDDNPFSARSTSASTFSARSISS